MIKLLQAGQFGAGPYLMKMHRLRTKVFKEMMQWNVSITDDHFEVDQFDTSQTVYLLVLNSQDDVVGACRLLPSTGPTMIRDVWPEYLQSIHFPRQPDIWELSRFAVLGADQSCKEGLTDVSTITAQMFCGLAELSVICGIQQIFAMHDHRIERLVGRINCRPVKTSIFIEIDGHPCRVGCYRTDERLLANLRIGAGIKKSLISPDELPPALHDLKGSRVKEKTRLKVMS